MRFLDFDLRPEKMTLKAQIFPDFFTSEGDRFPTFGGIFSDLRWKSKNRIGDAYSIVLRSRKIPHMTKSVHWFGCRLWCYRFKSLHILYFRLFCIYFPFKMKSSFEQKYQHLKECSHFECLQYF